MKVPIVLAAVAILLTPQMPNAQRDRHRVVPAKAATRATADPIFPDPDFQAAFRETLFCGGKSKELAPENCAST